MQITPEARALAEGFAGPTPFEVATDRGEPQPVVAAHSHSFDVVDAALDGGAARVEARRPDPERDAWAERNNRRAMALQLRTAGTDNLLVRS